MAKRQCVRGGLPRLVFRDEFVRVHGADPESWAARYGIEPIEYPCSECGAIFRTTIPVARGGVRGLIAPVCACGNADTPYVFVQAFDEVEADRG